MAAESQGSSGQRQAPPAGPGRWLRLAGAALLLLAASEVLWLWQTWPVRELLQPAVPRTSAR